ncbi:adenylate/guanylate cyclase domain-containing protein [Rhizobium mesosinicum]|uniref:Guanylate cyclase domain-containing protein n=1 Tax=Rhizobium mesosinicum TaxID=335017 RepID=A0ABS7H044_9HYPH|nr:adenylate/guanylate cyclase domain-containing protein [Rhizobium mesosinicum]MBW9055487.1 hypothetical protein [Rhizobium mesosinicum]
MGSKLLDGIIKDRHNSANLKIVFVDVVSYSRRRSLTQAQVVENFMTVLEEARADVARLYLTYAEANGVNFKEDIIFIPSGDGAAICFPFEGLHDVHLNFAKSLLSATEARNQATPCAKFEQQGWCNCHANFKLAVGISDGKAIIYRDVNKNYNVAGNAMNLAARVMAEADGGQILFTEEAYTNIIDLVGDSHLDEKFVLHPDVRIKNGKINIYQYIDSSLDYLNGNPPADIAMSTRARNAMSAISGMFPLPVMPEDGPGPAELEKMVQAIEVVGKALNDLNLPKIIDQKSRG